MKFHENPISAELFHSDGRIDAFRNFSFRIPCWCSYPAYLPGSRIFVTTKRRVVHPHECSLQFPVTPSHH